VASTVTVHMAEIGAGTVCCAVLCELHKIVGLTQPWGKVKAFRPAPTASSPSATRLAGLRAFSAGAELAKGGQLR
jgi:hypothetical protein